MIKDYEAYNERMSKTLSDKAFFIDKIYGAELVVDFGCADGSLVRYLNKIDSNLLYIGYDSDPSMIETAIAKTREPNICFVSSLEEIEEYVSGKKWAINFSSVLHEMDEDSLKAARAFIDKMKPSYICVRDMDYSCDCLSEEAKRKIEEDSLWKDYIESVSYPHWFTRAYIEYLLKRTYVENWEKEKNEKYFSGFDKFYRYLLPDEYKIIWNTRYCLPYQRLQWLHDFGFNYDEEQFTTHRQMIVSTMFNLPS